MKTRATITASFVLALVALASGVDAFAQEKVHDWTNKAGKTIRSKFISVDQKAVTIFANGRNYVVKLTDLGKASAELGEKAAKQEEASDSDELNEIYKQLKAEKAKKELAEEGSMGPLPDHIPGLWAPEVEATIKLLTRSSLGLEGKEKFGEKFLPIMRSYYATIRVTKTRTHMTTFYNMAGRKATVRGDSVSLLNVLPDGRVSSAFAFGQPTADFGQEMTYKVIFRKIK